MHDIAFHFYGKKKKQLQLFFGPKCPNKCIQNCINLKNNRIFSHWSFKSIAGAAAFAFPQLKKLELWNKSKIFSVFFSFFSFLFTWHLNLGFQHTSITKTKIFRKSRWFPFATVIINAITLLINVKSEILSYHHITTTSLCFIPL